jgi:hypothetical protein
MQRLALVIAALSIACVPSGMARAQAVQDRFPGADESKPTPPAAAPAPAQPDAAAKPAKPAPAAKPAAAAAPAGRATTRAAAPGAPHVIACKDAFAKDSSHDKLTTAFGQPNVSWEDVDAPEGSKIKATVLFPADPKRRLEVVWAQPEPRTGTQVIAINGQSTWTAPKGLKLGLPLALVEKLNGKPFRLTGFEKDSGGTVVSWEGGALAELPGGCRVSLRFEPDPKISPEVRKDVAVNTQFGSSDLPMRKAVPKVVEILIGY